MTMSAEDKTAGEQPLSRMAAGGTIASAPASAARRLYLILELLVLFVVGPLVMWAAVHGRLADFDLPFLHGRSVPLFLALLPVLVIVLVLLIADPTFHLRREFTRGFGWRTALTIAAVFILLGGGVAHWVAENKPEWFLEFPANRPNIYWKIMALYPLGSVVAQEIVYRTFYFHRYGPLFGTATWLGVILNAALFGFCHIVVGSSFAIAATTAGGLLLATRYATTRSFWAVFIEHTLWGWLVFTVGLGRFFFTGVPSVG